MRQGGERESARPQTGPGGCWVPTASGKRVPLGPRPISSPTNDDPELGRDGSCRVGLAAPVVAERVGVGVETSSPGGRVLLP